MKTSPQRRRQHAVTINTCFIATAAYGSPMAPEVDVLRSYRDTVLTQSVLGQQLTHAYYRLSPPVAKFIADKPWLRALARTLLEPILAYCRRHVPAAEPAH